MKYYALFILLILTADKLSAQNWLWAQGFSGTATQGGQNIISPHNRNIYCFGIYQPAGSVTAGNVTISSHGSSNGFVAQYNQEGNFITLINAPGSYISGPNNNGGIGFGYYPTSDDDNNIYTSVGISSNGFVDTIPVAGSPNSPLLAVSKWNSDSRCIWLHYYEGTSVISKFFGGYNYLLGNYQQQQIQIGAFQLSDPANKKQGYLAKTDAQGNCQWAKQAVGGNIIFKYLDIANNNICFTASTDSCFIYDTLNICAPVGKTLTVLMQLDTAGSVIWYKKVFASDMYSFIYKIAPIASSGFYVTGGLDTTLCIANDTLNKLSNEIGDDMIAKFDNSGNILWIKQIPINGSLLAISAITADSMGYFYLSGYFSGTQTFGNYTVTSQSARDLFVTRYSPVGECMGVVTVPNAQVYAMTEDAAGNAIVTGAVSGAATFGTTTLNTTSQTSFFVAKLSAINFPANEQNLTMNDSLLQIYSNPSRGLFTVTVPQGIIQAASGNLTVYDGGGTLIKTQPVDISTPHVEVNLGEVMRGVYTVLLNANGRQFTGRVVIQ